MTASLLVFVPVALLVLVGGFCFVGCVLDTSGYGLGWTQYSDLDVIANPDCIAYWPLSDSSGQTTALDVVGKAKGDPHNGTYKNVTTDPSLFPCPALELNPSRHSAGAPGTQTIGAAGIVVGDTYPPHDPKNPLNTTCMQTDGGFVIVPANTTTNPGGPFTVEFWALPEWPETDSPATHVVIDSRDAIGPDLGGFALWVNETGDWEASLGAAGMGSLLLVKAGKATLGAVNYVALTWDGTNAAVFVDGVLSSQLTPINFVPNTTFPLTIGVSGAFLADRTPGAVEPPPLFPILPFKGKIQNVAIYSTALDETTIKKHNLHGRGTGTE